MVSILSAYNFGNLCEITKVKGILVSLWLKAIISLWAMYHSRPISAMRST